MEHSSIKLRPINSNKGNLEKRIFGLYFMNGAAVQPYKVKLSVFQIPKIKIPPPSHYSSQCPLVSSEQRMI